MVGSSVRKFPVSVNTAVQNLEFNLDRRRFEWQTPEDTERCQIQFQIYFTNGQNTYHTSTSQGYFEFPLYPCTQNNINVTTWIGFTEKDGESVSGTHNEAVPGKLARFGSIYRTR